MHVQGTIFTAECYGNAFMVTIYAPQLDLLHSWCIQTGQVTEQIIISLQPTKALLDTLKLLVNFANVLGQAIQPRATQDVDVTLHVSYACYNEQTVPYITIMISSWTPLHFACSV